MRIRDIEALNARTLREVAEIRATLAGHRQEMEELDALKRRADGEKALELAELRLQVVDAQEIAAQFWREARQ